MTLTQSVTTDNVHRVDRFFEDFPVGTVCTTGGRTVDISDITMFAGLTGDHYPLHTDEQYASTTQFGTRIAHGPLTFSIAVGLVALAGFYGEAIVAMREAQSIRTLRPVKPGDTLEGTVRRLTDYGAFIELEPGVEGLIHISELEHSRELEQQRGSRRQSHGELYQLRLHLR